MLQVFRGTNPTVIAAIIAALVAAIVGVFSQYATYRLKVKEFRVTQIKSRIDILEQAVISAPDDDDANQESVDGASNIEQGIEAMKKAAWHRLAETEKQYTKYKWLLPPESHERISGLIQKCNSLSGTVVFAAVAKDVDALKQNLPSFVGSTQELQRAYEESRLAVIERLYFVLNREVGISTSMLRSRPTSGDSMNNKVPTEEIQHSDTR